MSVTHLHLMLTHIPIVGVMIALCIYIYGYYSKNDSVIKTALAVFIAMAIISIPVNMSGEGAEDAIKNIDAISQQALDQHEDLAEVSIGFMMALGGLSLITLFAMIKKHACAKKAKVVVLLLAIITCVLFIIVGNLGGKIRHVELRDVVPVTQGN